jgi:hypothetical protein
LETLVIDILEHVKNKWNSIQEMTEHTQNETKSLFLCVCVTIFGFY